MASEKKASEGIALLSMYGEEEDDEMEDLEEHIEKDQEEKGNPQNDAAVEEDDTVSNSAVASDSGTENTPWRQEERGGLNYNSTPKTLNYGGSSSATTTSQQPSLFSPQQQQQQQQTDGSNLNSIQSRKNMLTIVDYAHDEVAMSPEAEEGEIMETGQVKYGEELQIANAQLL